MTLVTRTAAKGILPRVHKPKPKRKPTVVTKRVKTAKQNKNGKRVVNEDSEDEEEESFSEDSDPPPKKKKRKQQKPEVEEESEVEEVEGNVEQPEENIEEVDANAVGLDSDDGEVSTISESLIHIQTLTRL